MYIYPGTFQNVSNIFYICSMRFKSGEHKGNWVPGIQPRVLDNQFHATLRCSMKFINPKLLSQLALVSPTSEPNSSIYPQWWLLQGLMNSANFSFLPDTTAYFPHFLCESVLYDSYLAYMCITGCKTLFW